MPLQLSVGCGGLDVQQGGVQLLEGLVPPLVARPGQVRGEPLSDLESGPSVGLVVELDSESRFGRTGFQTRLTVATLTWASEVEVKGQNTNRVLLVTSPLTWTNPGTSPASCARPE